VTPVVALTIAGSDSGGGAGIQADLKTFAAMGVFGASALTAVTAQHTAAVLAVQALDPGLVTAQVEAVLDDLGAAAVKTGMLATPATVAAVAALAGDGRLPNLVVDPVLVSSSGHTLMDPGGVEAYRRLLLPHAAVATPNLREAALLTGRRLQELGTVAAMREVAEELRGLGATTVVVKGGHLPAAGGAGAAVVAADGGEGAGCPDVVAGPDGTVVLPAPRVPTGNDHGTGCTLSAAIAARLALGADPSSAVADAKQFVHRALVGAARWHLGAGHGPIDHFGWSSPAAGGRPPPP
jgi:hydroxymethylpyrimidine/phosphomethylpyrimidine kinase